jgi:hypothetical protein
MIKLLTPLLVLAFTATALTGCNSSGKVVVTGLKVEALRIERTGDGATRVTWRFNNPNIAAYLLRDSSHRLFLGGTLVGTTKDLNPMAIPPGGSTERTTVLDVAPGAGERALTEAAGTGSAAYRIESQVTVQIYGDTIERGSLENSGTLSVSAK